MQTRVPKVSVVMPLYNKRASVSHAIQSVLVQTERDFELVVVDDGSTDGSSDVVRKIQDSRLRLIAQQNCGEGGARNRGIREARSDLIAFLDADDEWFPHFLSTAVALWERFPQAGAFATGFVACRGGSIIEFPHAGVSRCIDGELIGDYFRSCTLGSNMVWSSAVAIRRPVFEQVGMFAEGVKYGADLHMWARIALKYPIAWSPVRCAIWHLSAENRACVGAVSSDPPFASLLLEAAQGDGVSQESAYWIREYVAKFRLLYAYNAMERSDPEVAKRLLWLSRATRVSRAQWRRLAYRLYAPSAMQAGVRKVRKWLRSVRSGGGEA